MLSADDYIDFYHVCVLRVAFSKIIKSNINSENITKKMRNRFVKQKEKEREHAMPSLTWNRCW